MENIIKECERWSSKELEQLKLYISVRNTVKALTSDEINSNIAYRTFLTGEEDEIELESPDKLHKERLQYLNYIYFWLHIMSSDHSSVIDLACFRNEMECFIDEITSPTEVVATSETESNADLDTPTKRPRLEN
jgi:hypothetical protein